MNEKDSSYLDLLADILEWKKELPISCLQFVPASWGFSQCLGTGWHSEHRKVVLLDLEHEDSSSTLKNASCGHIEDRVISLC